MRCRIYTRTHRPSNIPEMIRTISSFSIMCYIFFFNLRHIIFSSHSLCHHLCCHVWSSLYWWGWLSSPSNQNWCSAWSVYENRRAWWELDAFSDQTCMSLNRKLKGKVFFVTVSWKRMEIERYIEGSEWLCHALAKQITINVFPWKTLL